MSEQYFVSSFDFIQFMERSERWKKNTYFRFLLHLDWMISSLLESTFFLLGNGSICIWVLNRFQLNDSSSSSHIVEYCKSSSSNMLETAVQVEAM